MGGSWSPPSRELFIVRFSVYAPGQTKRCSRRNRLWSGTMPTEPLPSTHDVRSTSAGRHAQATIHHSPLTMRRLREQSLIESSCYRSRKEGTSQPQPQARGANTWNATPTCTQRFRRYGRSVPFGPIQVYNVELFRASPAMQFHIVSFHRIAANVAASVVCGMEILCLLRPLRVQPPTWMPWSK